MLNPRQRCAADIALAAVVAFAAACALAGCGGSVIGVGGGGDGGPIGTPPPVSDDGGPTGAPGDDGGVIFNPGCPPPSSIGGGDECNLSGFTCSSGIAVRQCDGSLRPLGCVCNGAWACEEAIAPDCSGPPPGPPVPVCPDAANVFVSGACAVNGEQCTSVNVPVNGCGSPELPTKGTCTCTPSGWQCPIVEQPCPPPAPQPCPTPDAIYPGEPCPAPYGRECTSANIKTSGCAPSPGITEAACTCTPSGWECPVVPGPTCPPPPPPTCPSPYNVTAYSPCKAEGLTCKGNPQVCEGETFYDAFECRGEWIPIATTVCESANGSDAGVQDAQTGGGAMFGD